MHYYLKNATELLRANNIELAADTLHKVLNNPELVAANKLQHDTIVDEAKNYGKLVEANWQQNKTNNQHNNNQLNHQFAMPQNTVYGGVYQPNIMFADPNRQSNSNNGYKDPNFNK